MIIKKIHHKSHHHCNVYQISLLLVFIQFFQVLYYVIVLDLLRPGYANALCYSDTFLSIFMHSVTILILHASVTFIQLYLSMELLFIVAFVILLVSIDL